MFDDPDDDSFDPVMIVAVVLLTALVAWICYDLACR